MTRDQLFAEQRTVILSIRQLEKARLAAISTAQPVAAGQLAEQIIKSAKVYNGLISELRAIDKGTIWAFLVAVDDIEIPGSFVAPTFKLVNDQGVSATPPLAGVGKAITSATRTVSGAVSSAASAVGGILKAIQLLPVLLIGGLVIAGVYYYQKGKHG